MINLLKSLHLFILFYISDVLFRRQIFLVRSNRLYGESTVVCFSGIWKQSPIRRTRAILCLSGMYRNKSAFGKTTYACRETQVIFNLCNVQFRLIYITSIVRNCFAFDANTFGVEQKVTYPFVSFKLLLPAM